MNTIDRLYEIKKKILIWPKKYLTVEGLYTCILPDKIYLKKLYKLRTGKKLNLRNPQTFNEKLNWLKLHNRKPEYTVMADKYKVREFVANKIGEQYLVPLLGVWNSPDEIDFDALPNEFVLKCNHDNGIIICKDKSKLDIEKTKKELALRLSRDYFKKLREWPYKDIPRKIICEEYIKNKDNSPYIEYKVFCFNGVPEYFLVISDRFRNSEPTLDTYNSKWEYTDLSMNAPRAGNIYCKPECFDELCELSKTLSSDTPFLRVDFNFWNNNLFFGELTFYDYAGFRKYQPEEWDYRLGELLVLPAKNRR